MRKKLLLLSTAFATCATTTFAQENPVVKDGITYSVTSTTIEKDGDIANSPSNQTTITLAENQVGVNIIKIRTISGQKRNVILKATAIDETIAEPGQIISWSEDAAQPQDGIEKDYNTDITQFGSRPDAVDGNYAYEVRTDDPKYKLYVDACQKAIDYGKDLVLGSTLPSGTWDTDNFDVHPSLYYKVKSVADRRTGVITYSYEVVTSTTGKYSETTQYLNGCVDTYYPTTIDAEVGYNVSEGKVGVVTGVVNNARMEDIIAGNARNYDFTGAIIFGEINQTVPVNKLAYFQADTKLKDKEVKKGHNVNIVVGTQCTDFQIKDNGEEIYINEGFTATFSSYQRTFKSNTFGTVVLPFNISNTADVFEKQGRLTDYDVENNKISCTLADMIVANTPYLVKITGNADALEGDSNTPVKATGNAKSAVCNGAQFIGTFAPIKGSELTNGYVVGSDGTIGKLKATSTMKPGRCYFHYEGTINNAKMDEATIELIAEDGTVEIIEANLNGGETTAIDGVVNNSEVVSVQYISIDGQVSNEPVKGMNIVKKTYADGSVETTKVAF